MGRLLVITNLTLDGVMQSPGRKEEDTRDSFDQGGWAAPYNGMAQSGETLANMGALLFGRWTYENFASYFPHTPENPFSALLTQIPKFVASRTLSEPLPWENSTLLSGDATRSVPAAVSQMEKDLVVFGSGTLVQSLLGANVIDELVLLFHPIVLGSGRRLFPEGGVPASFGLHASTATPNGVLIAKYRPMR